MITAIGAGRMGRGIAHVFAYAGYETTVLDLKENRAAADFADLKQSALEEIRDSFQALADNGLFTEDLIDKLMARIQIAPRSQAGEILARTEIVFECVPEIIEAKHEALRFTESLLSGDVIIASTTSTILVDALAETMTHPERFLNAHWLNPAYLVPLVELSPGRKTAPQLTEKIKRLLEDIGKIPVVCSASPGYIVPRIQALAMNEAARMVEEGVASAEDIDKAIRFGFGFRFASIGMVEFIDWGGGDILYYASRYLREALAAERFAAPEIIERNMRDNRIGLRSGKGFYDFENRNIEQYRKETLARMVDLLKHIGATREPVV